MYPSIHLSIYLGWHDRRLINELMTNIFNGTVKNMYKFNEGKQSNKGIYLSIDLSIYFDLSTIYLSNYLSTIYLSI
jgi:hypothetical protein